MIDIVRATPADIEPLIELESALFREDGGQHDPFSDPNWPEREGRQDFEELMASPDGIVLAARRLDEIVGLLAGYAARASSTRQPVEFAVLRTMYVVESARRLGVATLLTEYFFVWARERGCVEAHVDHYADNQGAAKLYQSCGFRARSVSRVCPL
ncbi:MAG: GNAT family N-acetyltransferase [Acidimicrobiales bacterium]